MRPFRFADDVPSVVSTSDGNQRVGKLTVGVTVALIFVVLGVVAFALWRERQEIVSATERRAQTLVRIIEEQTGGSIAAVEVALTSASLAISLLPQIKGRHGDDITELL